MLYRNAWAGVRAVGRLLPLAPRETLFVTFAPVSVLVLLVTWVVQQVVSFSLIWRGLGRLNFADSFIDSLYFSGVAYFTLGFGEIVADGNVARFGTLFEAFSGVLSVAFVIGYLPSLFSASSEREQKILTLDD